MFHYWSWTSLLALVLATTAIAHRIDISQNDRQCFFEALSPLDRMTVTYEVGGSSSGSLDVDFWVTGPGGGQLHRASGQPQGSYSLTTPVNAPPGGRYTYCFGNSGSGSRTLSFNVHGVLHLDDDDQMMPVEKEIRELASNLQLVKDEQSYLVVRERVHRDTCESTNSRVKWWAVGQIGLLIGVCAWNVHYLKSWFEVKRVL